MAAMPQTNGKPAHLRILPAADPTTPLFTTLWLRKAEAEDILLVLDASLPLLIDEAMNLSASFARDASFTTLENVKRLLTVATTVRERLAYIEKQRQAAIDTREQFDPGPDPEPGDEDDHPF